MSDEGATFPPKTGLITLSPVTAHLLRSLLNAALLVVTTN